MQPIRRLYVAKKQCFADEEKRMLSDLRNNLLIHELESLRIFHRYDIGGLDEDAFLAAKKMIFSEPPVDEVYDSLTLNDGEQLIAIEYQPGQYDQRADSAMQCLQMLTMKNDGIVRTAKVIVFSGNLSIQDMERIQGYCINPVEARKASLDACQSLTLALEEPAPVSTITGFIVYTEEQLRDLLESLGLAMSFADLQFCQSYFREEEQRDPTITEIKVIDTYWSDHCRHTTFNTALTDITFAESPLIKPVREAYQAYQQARNMLQRKKPISLMDMATIAVKELRQAGKLQNLDISDEINACTIVVPVDVQGKEEEWLLLFKNETHNHPTEIEPFGGAATCLGGCIRDPLSGRAYVYQAMRITGSGDPRQPVRETLTGKLPQRTITTGAAKGYSSYGNQIGLATGEVKEYYHPGFIAKRMEIGAVIGAAPRENVVRKTPLPGDVVILLGGKTGRDGCGGATGSSKKHTVHSLSDCGAEVQKGNALTERKIQRLFRRGEVTRLIKRCNDFGAGGVSVAVGELTEGLHIQLDVIPKKYEGLDGTELAISESQERMAVVVDAADKEQFMRYAAEENLEATVIAEVTADKRLVMRWRDQQVVNLSRAFLDTNGVMQEQTAHVAAPSEKSFFAMSPIADRKQYWKKVMGTLNVASEQGLAEQFDSSIGAATMLMPFGGIWQKTPVAGMVAALPVRGGQTETVSIMTHGYDPNLASWSPFHGGLYAVLLSLAKLVALGGKRQDAYLTLQEFFPSLGTDDTYWGLPVSALLGAYKAQKELGIAAIGGKDSMSGTFEQLTVPPTLVSFAVVTAKRSDIISPEFKEANHIVLLVQTPRDEVGMPNFEIFKQYCDALRKEQQAGTIFALRAVDQGGVAAALVEMAVGNRLGVQLSDIVDDATLFQASYGDFIVEMDEASAQRWEALSHVMRIGMTQEKAIMSWKDGFISLMELQGVWEDTLSSIFPLQCESKTDNSSLPKYTTRASRRSEVWGKPTVFIPVFPGTNCEYDSAAAFERVGANVDMMVLKNNTAQALQESMTEMVKRLNQAQIIFFPGGFSAGDEPDGSGKFIATVFRNPVLSDALERLLYERDGLALGICNGFQALIKLGLLPYGHVQPLAENSPTLTYNTIGRHISRVVQTKVVSVLSPWFNKINVGDIHSLPISHGEGRFVASAEMIKSLCKQGQIATQYVDMEGNATYNSEYNPNQSVFAIEGITSPDGRVLGKMAHSERSVAGNVLKNIHGNMIQPLFAGGVEYFE